MLKPSQRHADTDALRELCLYCELGTGHGSLISAPETAVLDNRELHPPIQKVMLHQETSRKTFY